MDVKSLIHCADFAAKKHKDQRRKDPEKTPYINHPIGVAHILTEEAGITDINVIQAALLHDTVEDTDTTFQELKEEFGDEIAGIVNELSDNKSLSKAERKRLQIVHASTASPKAKLVKLADKIYNLRDLQRTTPEGWTSERVEEYFYWAAEVVKGLRGTNAKMEAILNKIFTQQNVPLSS